MTIPDISSLNAKELRDLALAAQERAQQVQIDGIARLRERWRAEAAEIGLSVEEILGINVTQKRRGRKPKQRLDENGPA